MRAALALAFGLLMAGCTASHGLTVDGGGRASDPGTSSADAASSSSDGGADAGVDPGADGGVASTPCGPNRCYHGEVCCSALCGWCGPEGSCGDTIDLCE